MHGLLIDSRDSQTPGKLQTCMVCMLLCIAHSGLLQKISTFPLVYDVHNKVHDPFVHKDGTCARITQKTNTVRLTLTL